MDTSRIINKKEITKLIPLWARYFELAEKIISESDATKLERLLVELGTRDLECCQVAVDNLCEPIWLELQKKGVTERQERCLYCPLKHFCDGRIATQPRIHTLVRLALENERPYSETVLQKAKILARSIYQRKSDYDKHAEILRKYCHGS